MIDKNKLRYTFRHSERLHLQKDFDRVMKKGRKLVNPAVFVYFIQRADGSALRRLGLITSSKVGNAVKRNRLKRRLREIFRLNKNNILPGVDMVFILRKAGVNLEYSKLNNIVLTLFKKGEILL